MAKILMVTAPNNFRDEELFIPKEKFENAGHEVVIASNKVGVCKGTLSGEISSDMLLKDVNVDDFQAVVFVGGTGSDVFFNDENALKIAREADKKGKVLSAICIAPMVLANAGVLTGKKATVWSGESENLKAKSVIYTGEAVTVDGKIITGNGPSSAGLFGEKICEAI